MHYSVNFSVNFYPSIKFFFTFFNNGLLENALNFIWGFSRGWGMNKNRSALLFEKPCSFLGYLKPSLKQCLLFPLTFTFLKFLYFLHFCLPFLCVLDVFRIFYLLLFCLLPFWIFWYFLLFSVLFCFFVFYDFRQFVFYF